MQARLFVIPASHPSISVALMLEQKRIAYKRTDLLPVISKGALRAAGFPGGAVPALRIGGVPGPPRGSAGTRLRAAGEPPRPLPRLAPGPPLFPADPEHRAAVEAAER